MVTCPKCGGNKILGPKYISEYGRESLRYTCYQCGFVTHGPTVEQQRQPSPRLDSLADSGE